MSEYLIQDTTLDAIADAINAKTGGSSAMTPAEMVTAIGNIPSGGAKVLTKLATYTVSDSVATISITATAQMRSCEMLYIECVNLAHSEDWIYPVINGGSIAGNGMGYTSKNSNYNGTIFLSVPRTELINANSVTVPARFFGGLTGGGERSGYLSTIDLKQYSSPSVFTSGTVNVWGYV